MGIRSHGKGIFHKEPVTGISLGEKRVFWVQQGCLILNIIFAWEQAVAKTSERESGLIASHRFPMYHPKEREACIDFFVRFFLRPQGKHLLGLASPGGAGRNRTLGQKEFEKLKVILPSLPEQQKIAAFLTAVDERIGQLSQKKALLEEYKKGVMQQLFTQALRFKDDNGKDYPDWEENEFGRIAEKSKTKYNPTTSKKEWPCVELESLSQNTGKLLETFSALDQKSIKNKFIAGEVLFGKLRPYLRKYLHAEFEGVCSSEIWVLRGKSVTNAYLFHLIQTHKFIQAANVSSGSKMPRSDWDFLSSIPFNHPSSSAEQTKIAKFLSALDRKIESVATQITETQTFKKGLLQQMFV
jgi:type I restriction enzyme S subunit